MKQLIFLAILSSACLYGAAQQIKQKPVPKEKKELPYYDPSTMSKNGGQGYQDTFSVDHILFRIIHHDSLYDGIVQKKERGKWTEVLRFENLGNHNDYFINKDLNNDGYPDICLEWKWDMETFFYNPQQKTFLKQSVWLPHEWYLLDQAKGIRTLDQIGMSPENLVMLREAINKPYGMILITGPTGSGKSTTLYSVLNEIDREAYNVLSLEDPVEYSIEGVSQSQVRPEIGYTFAAGLRTTLRQDPDIIMVGEIRDKETAQLAVQAALTGHLVFSTLHTNNSAGVIPRLIDMGVDPYLIAPTLILSVAQRLVSVLCPGGGELIQVDGSMKVMIDREFEDLPEQYRSKIAIGDTMYKIKPTPDCPKGTRGRMAVFEMFRMDKEIEEVILKSPTENEIMKILRRKGMLTVKNDAILKASQKVIPFEEVTKL